MIGRWLIKHYRIVNIVIICIVLTTILLMDTHISILGPLLPKVDMILKNTLYDVPPRQASMFSPPPNLRPANFHSLCSSDPACGGGCDVCCELPYNATTGLTYYTFNNNNSLADFW